ncbi:hypothetical protein CORC01_09155 [Colletotrichum orchidophilum]|uniref:Uncharacterized protein n=1 Tax=Colletotrichum orchidophilum TaxID=1209926 RepID=A0A1G4B2L5_9PEZI|nr:uncharacterized protein CORC01_09155 [Colletotrichum orchidophilum]OHE95565.1 hypothetical protein CORC01_09155 [Colletotrichum orchidophilum]
MKRETGNGLGDRAKQLWPSALVSASRIISPRVRSMFAVFRKESKKTALRTPPRTQAGPGGRKTGRTDGIGQRAPSGVRVRKKRRRPLACSGPLLSLPSHASPSLPRQGWASEWCQ